MDQLVLKTQQWLNKTYDGIHGYEKVPENGKTGWTTIYALTRALQIELGISEPADNFGPTTSARFQPLMRGFDQGEPNNQIYILQGALWCKGIGPGSFTGIFDQNTELTVKNFQADAGLINQDGIVTTQIMKALLDMSAFVLVPGGDSRIREMQQNLNRDYNAYFGLQPCDGLYGRNTNKALIYALQKEEGMPVGVANGYFGNGTTQKCPTLTLNDPRQNFVLILQYALYCNGFDPGTFNGQYTSSVQSAVSEFQEFIALPVTRVANMPTIKALLSSAGDTNRDALACDCATILTPSKAKAIKSAGFNYVGRYLTGTVGGTRSKAMTRNELDAIFNAGLNIFPIYEDGGYELEYFTSIQGEIDAHKAKSAAQMLGIPFGTTIYFAVDFDALDEDITSNILPYFNGINSALSNYKIGIYGARNICTRVSEAGYAEKSFVADMSTGFSGNLGFKMPGNWAFDQFNTITIGNPSLGYVEVDMNAYSGKDEGFGHVNPVTIDPNPSDPIPSDEEIYMAKFNKLYELTSFIPALRNLSAAAIAFDSHPYVVRFGLLTITLKASTELTIPGDGYTKFTVKNGELSSDFSSALNAFSSLSISQKISYENLTNELALSIDIGDISVKISNTGTAYSIEFISNYKNVPVNDSYNTTLSSSLTFTIDYTDPTMPPETSRVPDVSLDWPMVAELAVLVVAASAMVLAAPEIAAAAVVTSFVVVVKGLVDDFS